MIRSGLLSLIFFLALVPSVQGQVVPPDPEGPNPVPAVDGVFIEEMTWMEIRDAMQAGKTTAIIATGASELSPVWFSNSATTTRSGTKAVPGARSLKIKPTATASTVTTAAVAVHRTATLRGRPDTAGSFCFALCNTGTAAASGAPPCLDAKPASPTFCADFVRFRTTSMTCLVSGAGSTSYSSLKRSANFS